MTFGLSFIFLYPLCSIMVSFDDLGLAALDPESANGPEWLA
jgi:hypothetical protein